MLRLKISIVFAQNRWYNGVIGIVVIIAKAAESGFSKALRLAYPNRKKDGNKTVCRCSGRFRRSRAAFKQRQPKKGEENRYG